ncbi:MAG: TIGR03915 family putative DNA repair protein [Massiliimalia sp.]|jgi:probable DNA metabolism protein
MSHRTDITWANKPLIYEYDGSYDGLMCCVFEAFLCKELPMEIRWEETPLGGLCGQTGFAPVKWIETDREKASRVKRWIPKKISRGAEELVQKGFLSCLEQKELCILRFLVRGYQYGPAVMNRLADPAVHPLWKAVGHYNKEAHLLTGFVRFSMHNGVLVSVIGPKNMVLPALQLHFCARYPNQTFMIYDSTHGMALVHQPGRTGIIPMDEFVMSAPDVEEQKYRKLWKLFYDTIAVEGRENPRCRMSHMPKRYWSYMTEFCSLPTDTPQTGELSPHNHTTPRAFP